RCSHLNRALCSWRFMENFKISRVHTKLGIFRLSGILNNESGIKNISYISAEYMGTDGWCELNLQSEHTQNLLRDIQIEVLQHLA
ncbi:hypothetical protein, partial [Vibrio vulnificus]|uniref:hypothetical protein n=2 Tax=Vibrio vulnificus TaxID=672 RepID=UPI001C3E4692